MHEIRNVSLFSFTGYAVSEVINPFFCGRRRGWSGITWQDGETETILEAFLGGFFYLTAQNKSHLGSNQITNDNKSDF